MPFQGSQPYNRMVLILELNNRIFLINAILHDLQIVVMFLKAVIAFPVLLLMSFSEPPRPSMTLSKCVKDSTSSRGVAFSLKLV